MKFELFVALRYLRVKRKQGFISLITVLSMAGVALGVCALIVVLSVMGGFEREWKKKILGLNSHVLVYGLGGGISDPEKVMDKVRRDPDVTAVTPFVYGQVMILAPGEASGALMRGIDVPTAIKVLDLKNIMVSGSLEDLQRPEGQMPGLVVGTALARSMGLHKGGVVTVVNPLGEDTPVGRLPRSEPFQVVGTFESGMYQYDSSICFAALGPTKDFFGLGGKVSGLELTVRDIYDAPEVAKRLDDELGFAYYTRDWIAMNHSLFAALKLERVVMFIILTLIVMVAAFGIVSSLIMLVMDKTSDIGALKAMGASSTMIRRVFTMVGLTIGVLGTLVGLLAGLGLCALLTRYQFIELPKDIYALGKLPVEIDPLTVAIIAASAIVISLAATIYPAHKAGAMDPVDALRYE